LKFKLNKIGIYLRPKIDANFKATIKNLTEWLSARDIHFTYLNYEHKNKTPIRHLDNDSLNLEEIDLIICLGGDGTLISLLRKLNSNSPPVFGVNLGTLGFTTEFNKSYLFEDLAELIENKHTTSTIQLFQAKIFNKKRECLYERKFVNDAVFSKEGISRIISLSLEANGNHIYNIQGDGLIISTPMGSTAYSLAANGPIIYPEVDSLVITPICPHSLTHRPIVIPNNFLIKVEPIKNKTPPIMTLDGQNFIPLEQGQFAEITKAPRGKIKIIENPDKEYFHTLKTKFTLGRK